MKVKEKSLLDKFGNMDRRILYWSILVLMVATYLRPIGLPVPITPYMQDFYNGANSLPSGAVVLISQDCDPTRFAEYGGGIIAFVKHLSRRPVKIIIFTVADPAAVPITEQYLIPILKDAKKTYGVDYVHIGYIPGSEAAVVRTADDLHGIISKDYYGNDIADLELMKHIDGALDIKNSGGAIMVTGAGSFMFTRQDWTVKYDVPCFAIVGSGELGSLTPYKIEGKIDYLCAGLRACAEYERLINSLGLSSGALEALTTTAVLLMALIVISNVSYISQRRKQ